MKIVRLFLFVLVALVLCSGGKAEARPLKVCINSSGTAIAKRRCRAGKGESSLTSTLIQGLNNVLCHANIRADGTIWSFGGSSTTNVTVDSAGGGIYEITCNGDFSAVSSNQDLSVIASADSGHNVIGISSEETTATSVSLYISSRANSNNALTPAYFSFAVIGPAD